jgi:FkbM family methyltransferase
VSVATESLEPAIRWLDSNANIVGIVNDLKLGTAFGAHQCRSTADIVNIHRKFPEAIFVNSTVQGNAQTHFNIAAAQSEIPTLSLLHFHRLLRLLDEITIPIRPLGLLETSDVLSFFDATLELEQAYARIEAQLHDHYSKITLYGLLLYRLTGDAVWHRHVSVGKLLHPYDFDSYIFNKRFFNLSDSEVYVDAGAYRGETVELFARSVANKFVKIHAFEPDKENFAHLEKFVADRFGATRLNVECHQAGIWETSGRLKFCSADSGSGPAMSSHFELSEDSEVRDGNVEVVSLDDCLADEVPTFIKLEIEGSELAALRGARRTIVRCRPKVALSAYHKARDLVTLFDNMLELDAGYKIGLAHHRDSIAGSVYYCVPV